MNKPIGKALNSADFHHTTLIKRIAVFIGLYDIEISAYV